MRFKVGDAIICSCGCETQGIIVLIISEVNLYKVADGSIIGEKLARLLSPLAKALM